MQFDLDAYTEALKVSLLSGDIERLKRLRSSYGKRTILLETTSDIDLLYSMEIDKRNDTIDFALSYEDPHILDELKAEFFGRYVCQVLDGKPLDDLPWLKFIDFGLTPDEVFTIHERLQREV